jgi:hypothetical protein
MDRSVVVFVVCLKSADAVEVDVYVNSTVEGTRAANPLSPNIAVMPEFQAVSAADSLAELELTDPKDHG